MKKLKWFMPFVLFLLPMQADAQRIQGGDLHATTQLDSVGVRIEAPDQFLKGVVSINAVETSDAPGQSINDGAFTLVKDFDLSLTNTSSMGIHDLDINRPMRVIFTIDDALALSKENLSIAYFSKDLNEWDLVPTHIYWNGEKGEVEGEIRISSGKVALLWGSSISNPVSNSSDQPIRLMFNNYPVSNVVAPYIKDGTTMVPLRIISDNIGIKADWNSKDGTIDLLKKNDKIHLQINNTQATVNSKNLELSEAPEVVENRTFVPLRFIAEALGAQVSWNDITKTVNISVNK